MASNCASCGAPPAGGQILTCRGCGNTTYCNSLCQRAHWKIHRGACKAKQAELAKLDQRSVTPSQWDRAPLSDVLLRKLSDAAKPDAVLRVAVEALYQAHCATSTSTGVKPIVTNGALAAVIAIMSTRRASSQVAEWGCATLQNMAGGHVAAEADAVVAAGGAYEAVSALDAHGSNEGVATAGCAALCHMCQGTSLTAILAAGGPRAVTAALRLHIAGTSHVAENAVKFYASLCCTDSVVACAAIASSIEAGSLPLLVFLFNDQPALRRNVIDLLAVFASHGQANLEALIASGGHVPLTAYLLGKLFDATKSDTTLAVTVEVLQQVHRASKTYFEPLAAVASVVAIMSARRAFAEVAQWGCAILQSFALRSKASADAVVAAGGAYEAVSSLDMHGSIEGVAMAGCDALCHMCQGSTQSLDAVVAAGGPRAVTAALKVHITGSSCVVENAAYFYAEIASRRRDPAASRRAIAAAVEAGCLPLLVLVFCNPHWHAFRATISTLLTYYASKSYDDRPANSEALIAAGCQVPLTEYILRKLSDAAKPDTTLAVAVEALLQVHNAFKSYYKPTLADGAVASVIAIMSAKRASSEVAEWGCAILQNSAVGGKADADAVVAAGGAYEAVSALDVHGSIEGVATAGCAALCHMCQGSTQTLVAIVAAGGPRAVTAALKVHITSACVAQNAANFFTWLCRDDAAVSPAIAAAIEAGCLPVLVLLSRKHESLRRQVSFIFTGFAASEPLSRADIAAAMKLL